MATQRVDDFLDLDNQKVEKATWSSLNIGDSLDNREALFKKLKKQLKTDLKEKIEDTNGIKKNVNSVWVGNDADAFIKEFNNRVTKAKADIDGYYTTLENRLKQINTDWQTARDANKKNIEGSAN